MESAQPIVPAETALALLREGNERYVRERSTHPNLNYARRQELRGGQHPFAAVLSCADSRVVPELVFDEGLGDLFVVRVAGNVANLSSLASLEYAVGYLGVRLIVVMGHEACGAVTAAIGSADSGPHLNRLFDQIRPALVSLDTDDVNEAVRVNARYTAAKALKRSKLLRNIKGLRIIPAYYNLGSGRVDFLE